LSLNIVFAGTPDFAARHLQQLINSEHNVIAVYSQPDRPAGRGKKLQASAVKQLALQHDIEVLQPQSLKTEEAQQQLASLNADIMVVVAYGLILPQAVLDTPKFGCINVHGSILPKWRGAAPIQRSIWAGDQETGVTIMQMDKGLDTGDILHIVKEPISTTETSATLYEKLANSGPKALLETLSKIALGSLVPEPQQNELASYAEKLSKQEAAIDWNQPAAQLARNVRAFNPWPVAFFEITVDDSTHNIKVWQAEVTTAQEDTLPGTVIKADKHGIAVKAAEGALLLKQIQIPGKKPMQVADILNSKSDWFKTGSRF
jgi:methionyl-tRNA formyltransferase